MGTDERTGLVVASAGNEQLAAVGVRPDVVIAADSGLHPVMAHGWVPDHVVGDMDSVDPDALTAAQRAGAVIERHAVAKDETDLELALATALRLGVTDLEIVARGDGRLDHQLANLFALAAPELSAMRISAAIGDHRVWVVRGRCELELLAGAHLALHAVGGPAVVTTNGVAYPLAGETLSPFEGRGIANEVVVSPVQVDVSEGVVLVVSSPRRTSGPVGVRD